MDILAGTSGYSYKEWRGIFYPDDLPDEDMLRYYAARFPTVEINNTFYRMPGKEVIASWAEEVPEGFTFVLKASRYITHLKRLKDVAQPTQHFHDLTSVLGPRLGPSLFQLHPTMKKDLDRLQTFLGLLPADRPAALELKHESWNDPDVDALLKTANVARCISDNEGARRPALTATADFGYLRLRRCNYSDAELEQWIADIESQPWRRAFVFFKHEEESTGPMLAKRLLQLRGNAAAGGSR
jgi:uncharacterized protein YecE (DUF72 family)